MGAPADLVARLAPGERVYLPGSAAEVIGLAEALAGGPALRITTTYVPGINPLPLAGLPHGTVVRSPFAYGAAQAGGSFAHLPLSYGAFVGHLRDTAFDTAIVQVAPPDADGRCSLGPAVEFTPLALPHARRVIGVLNPHMPRMPRSADIPFHTFDSVLEVDAPLREYDVGAPSGVASAIARHVAVFIEDGAALQIGLGKVPDALLRMLTDRRRLHLFSGMLSDGTRLLAEAGALAPGAAHTSCVHVGTAGYYDWLAGRGEFSVRDCGHTHAMGVLAALPRLVAVNTALSVDLFGQANLEMLDGREVSGVGGAAEFSRGAVASDGGISIIALPASAGRADTPRIVPRLDGICSLPRQDVQVVESGRAHV